MVVTLAVVVLNAHSNLANHPMPTQLSCVCPPCLYYASHESLRANRRPPFFPKFDVGALYCLEVESTLFAWLPEPSSAGLNRRHPSFSST